MKKVSNENPMVFAQTTETWKVSKFSYNEEGEIINPDFNNRTYLKKAHKAYLKGKMFFSYKGNAYPVPRMTKKQLEDLGNGIESNEENIYNLVNEEE